VILGIIALASAITAPEADMALARQLHREVNAAHLKLPFYRIVTLIVSPEGRIISCEPGEGKGDAHSMAQVCRIASAVRFKRAAKVDGKPAYGRMRTIITGFDNPSDMPQVAPTPEMLLSVNRLPDGVKDALHLYVNVLVSPTGHVERCEATNDKDEAYAKVACVQLAGQTSPVVNDREGNPVSYVNAIRVRFVADEAS
jgi:hypothetical protein